MCAKSRDMVVLVVSNFLVEVGERLSRMENDVFKLRVRYPDERDLSLLEIDILNLLVGLEEEGVIIPGYTRETL